ncbi:MAG TPA: hypothetical protein VGB75_03895 [Jatrophihabitans sp.]|jgi:hypothetical protein|uniref:hypothetical protein n=1 Tax=Jatrophihabitans sp. TaxID=1932789 RepID=UPI002F1607C0
MELYAERLRLAAQADAEARGESLWTAEIPPEALVKLKRAWKNACVDVIPTNQYGTSANTLIAEALEVSLGLESNGLDDAGSRLRFANSTPEVLSVLEAMDMAFDEEGLLEGDSAQQFFRSEVNRIFEAHRVAFRLVEGQIIPVESFEMNAAVVFPALYLLHGHAEFASGEKAYMKALQEIRVGDAGDAITDAATALQETLEALGCEGRTLGPLIASAKRRGLFSARDSRLTDAIAAFAQWAAAERNEGEAHHYTESDLSDAWLMVHVVGALIVRLAQASNRAVPTPFTE